MEKSIEEILFESKAAVRLYFQSEMERYKLIAIKRATKYVSSLVKLLIILSFGAIALFFLFASIAMYWAEQINSLPLALLYTAGIVTALIIIILLLSKYIITRPVMRNIINEVFDDE